MYSSATTPIQFRPAPTLGMRIDILQRRFRFAMLLSRLTGRTLEEAWRVFRPFPGPADSGAGSRLGAA